MDEFFAFAFFIFATLTHLVLAIFCNSEIKRISGGYLITMARLFTTKGVLPKLASISFFVLLISIAVLLTRV